MMGGTAPRATPSLEPTLLAPDIGEEVLDRKAVDGEEPAVERDVREGGCVPDRADRHSLDDRPGAQRPVASVGREVEMRHPIATVPVFVAALAALSMAGRPATGTNVQVDPREWLPEAGLFLPVGVALGGAIDATGGRGRFFAGAEASLVWADPRDTMLWVGGYADFVGEPGARRVAWSIGPELGWGGAGLDLGYVLASDAGTLHHGFAARALLTVGVFAVFARYTYVAGATDALSFGVLLKYPIRLD